MRPVRLVLFLLCVLVFPLVFTILSVALSNRSQFATSNGSARTRLKGSFLFDSPSSLFPPSAVISLFDDNSTFFLARPAAYGPSLRPKGMSGELWVGSGFSGENMRGIGVAAGAGELGCSDVHNDAQPGRGGKAVEPLKALPAVVNSRNSRTNGPGSMPADKTVLGHDSSKAEDDHAALDDGTDNHLNMLLSQTESAALHADIQSLQETAEISGKIVLLSRGGCGFLDKTKWAQKRGAIALIVGDDVRRGGLITMYARGDTSNITIPSIFTSHTTAQLLSSLIPELQAKLAGKKSRIGVSGHAKSRPGVSSTASSIKSKNKGLPSSTANTDHPSEKSKRSWLTSWFVNDQVSGSTNSRAWEKEIAPDAGASRAKVAGSASDKSAPPVDVDEFIIGEHDWRDPDLRPISSTSTKQSGKGGQSSQDSSTGKTNKLPGSTKSSTSGSTVSDNNVNKQNAANPRPQPEEATAAKTKPEGASRGFFTSIFGGKNDVATSKASDSEDAVDPQWDLDDSDDREGLWVTLTPASFSSSPFFDTLLVLVISPLVTLTVVYTILLIRSRIRRRRWRAPKSLVDRLPVRVYHTLTSSSSSSPPFSAGDAPSLTTPLLQSSQPPSRQRSMTTSDVGLQESRPLLGQPAVGDDIAGVEKRLSRSRRSRSQRMFSSQVECVVCLEEYVDGISRVMRLPCGHEFHAACITPWLTHRRRTCPICKGDIVQSMTGSGSSSTDADEDSDEDAENQTRSTGRGERRGRSTTSRPWTNWRNIVNMSRGVLVAFSGDRARSIHRDGSRDRSQ